MAFQLPPLLAGELGASDVCEAACFGRAAPSPAAGRAQRPVPRAEWEPGLGGSTIVREGRKIPFAGLENARGVLGLDPS